MKVNKRKIKRNIKTVKDVIAGILFTISILFCAWIILSYVDVVSHNLSGGTDNPYNYFVLITKGFQQNDWNLFKREWRFL